MADPRTEPTRPPGLIDAAAHDAGQGPAAGGRAERRPVRPRVPSALARRPVLLAALIYAFLSVVMVAPGLMPGRTLSGSDYLYNDAPWQSTRPVSVPGLGANFELADAADVFEPFLRYTRSRLPSLPLWNPYISAGRPYLANTQSAVFSPFNLPAYVVSLASALAVMAALKLFVGALGAFVLARALGMRLGGALLTGLVFAFGTFYVIWLAWPLTNIFPLIPWLLFAVERLVRRPGPRPAAGLGALVALAYFGGHPETTFHALFVTVVFFLFRAWSAPGRARAGPRGLIRPALALAFALVAGSLAAAIVFVPFAELLAHSSDLARRAADGQGYWPRKYLFALFLHDYWGRATQNSNIAPFMQLRGWYAGAMTLMLAAAAVILRPNRLRLGLLVFALFVICMVIGIPPVWGVVVKLPGFSSAHNERMLIDFLLIVALLAGFGLDELSGGALPARRRRLVLMASGAIFLVPILAMAASQTLTATGLGTALKVAWGFVHPPPLPIGVYDPAVSPQAGIIRMSALLQWIPLAAIGLALIALRLRPGGRLGTAAFVTASLVLIAADLFRANMGFNPAIPVRNANPPRTGAIRYLQSQRPNRFVGVSTNITFQPLPADRSMAYGLYDARGYDYPAEARYNTLWRRYVAPGVPDFAQPIETASDTPASLRALDLLSVSDLIVDPHYPPQTAPGLSVAYRGRDAIVYRNAGALPRVFTASAQQTVHGAAAALAASTAPGFDRRHVVVTESAVPGLAPSSSVPGGSGTRSGATGAARLLSYRAERIVATATVTRPAMFVLTDTFYPGWTATVDGHAAPIQRVDYLLRGVRLTPGTHRIVLGYTPASVTVGELLSLVGLLALLAATAAGVRERRRGR